MKGPPRELFNLERARRTDDFFLCVTSHPAPTTSGQHQELSKIDYLQVLSPGLSYAYFHLVLLTTTISPYLLPSCPDFSLPSSAHPWLSATERKVRGLMGCQNGWLCMSGRGDALRSNTGTNVAKFNEIDRKFMLRKRSQGLMWVRGELMQAVMREGGASNQPLWRQSQSTCGDHLQRPIVPRGLKIRWHFVRKKGTNTLFPQQTQTSAHISCSSEQSSSFSHGTTGCNQVQRVTGAELVRTMHQVFHQCRAYGLGVQCSSVQNCMLEKALDVVLASLQPRFVPAVSGRKKSWRGKLRDCAKKLRSTPAHILCRPDAESVSGGWWCWVEAIIATSGRKVETR